jgi:hypothetical protein
MDYDDFVQEGILAWLEGRRMYPAMLRAFGKSAKMSYYSYSVKGMHEPQTLPLDDFVDSEASDTPDIEHLHDKVDASKIMRRITRIENEQIQFALLGYLYFGMTLRDLGEVFGKSHEWVRSYLIEPELVKLREEFKC